MSKILTVIVIYNSEIDELRFIEARKLLIDELSRIDLVYLACALRNFL